MFSKHTWATPTFLVLSVVILFAASSAHALDLSEHIASPFLEAEKTISMDFKDAQLNDVLKIFSQQSGMNFIAATDIASLSINVYLDEVPVEEALERILSAHNLTYELKPGSNIFLVKQRTDIEPELITRIYSLKYATVPTSKLKTTLSAFGSGDEEGGGESASGSSAEVTAAGGIIAAVQALLSTQGRIVEDARTNSIIVTDIPVVFPKIEQTIARLDVRTPQILIEAEMLDVSADTAKEFGAKFGSTPFQYSGPIKNTFFPFNEENILSTTSQDFGEDNYTAGTISFAGLTVALSFLTTQTDTKNLARPRILTLNNETAEIAIQTDEVIAITQTTSSIDGLGTSTVEAERADTGVFLRVTPQANLQTGEIVMAVEPRVVTAKPSSGFAASSNFKDPEIRTARSILRIMDGETVIIGGLLRTDVTNVRTNVPWLSKVPVLGAAFRHKDVEEEDRELMVFITPKIMQETFLQRTATSPSVPVVREQDIPASKQKRVQQELSLYEKKR